MDSLGEFEFEESQILKFLTDDDYKFDAIYNGSFWSYNASTKCGCFVCEEPIGKVDMYIRAQHRKTMVYISFHENCLRATAVPAVEKLFKTVAECLEGIMNRDVLGILKTALVREYYSKIKKAKVIKLNS